MQLCMNVFDVDRVVVSIGLGLNPLPTKSNASLSANPNAVIAFG
jgi:hypothetical protein